jgi:hypothetical protein
MREQLPGMRDGVGGGAFWLNMRSVKTRRVCVALVQSGISPGGGEIEDNNDHMANCCHYT